MDNFCIHFVDYKWYSIGDPAKVRKPWPRHPRCAYLGIFGWAPVRCILGTHFWVDSRPRTGQAPMERQPISHRGPVHVTVTKRKWHENTATDVVFRSEQCTISLYFLMLIAQSCSLRLQIPCDQWIYDGSSKLLQTHDEVMVEHFAASYEVACAHSFMVVVQELPCAGYIFM